MQNARESVLGKTIFERPSERTSASKRRKTQQDSEEGCIQTKQTP